MPKRKTVKLNVELTKALIKSKCRSNVVFCEHMHKHERWVSDWGKTPPKNLPSPEEAAQMCAILQVKPEEILTEPADVELVQNLLDGQKEKPAPEGELTDIQKEAMAFIRTLSPEQLSRFLKMGEAAFSEEGPS